MMESISTNQLLPNELWKHILNLSLPDGISNFRLLDRNARALVDETASKCKKLVQEIRHLLGDDFLKDLVCGVIVKYPEQRIRKWDYNTLYCALTRFQAEELKCVLPLTKQWEYTLDEIKINDPTLKFYQMDQRIRNINLVQLIFNGQTDTVCRKQSLRCVLGLDLGIENQTLDSVANRIREYMREGRRTQNPRFTMLFDIYANNLGLTRISKEVCCMEEVKKIEINENHIWRIPSEISRNSLLQKVFLLNNPLYALSGKLLWESKVVWWLSQGYCNRLQFADKQALLITKVCSCGAKGFMVLSRSQFQRAVVKASCAFLSILFVFQMPSQIY